MKTIRLHGELAKKFGREYYFDVRTPAEAVRALCSQVKGFKQYLQEHQQDAFKVFVGGRNTSDKDDVTCPASDKEIIRIAPVIQGAKGAAKVILGVILLVVTAFFPNPYTGSLGWSMIIGGVVEMLSPVQKGNSGTDSEAVTNRPSYNFNGPVNTLAQGHPVPLAYGRVMCGSAVISAGMETR